MFYKTPNPPGFLGLHPGLCTLVEYSGISNNSSLLRRMKGDPSDSNPQETVNVCKPMR